jgi:hypothetical protein
MITVRITADVNDQRSMTRPPSVGRLLPRESGAVALMGVATRPSWPVSNHHL